MNPLSFSSGFKKFLLFLLFAATGVSGTSFAAAEPADLVLVNGVVLTMDERFPTAEAVAVRAGRIVAVGTTEEVRARAGGETRVIDLAGRTAMPGLIDGHVHFAGIGEAKMQLDLMNRRSWAEIVELVAEAVAGAEPGELILGRGWHQNDWETPPARHVQGLPFHDELSAISPENPVVLTHASGHMTFANRRAMEMAGVSAATEDPRGGEVVRDEHGKPTGAFRQRASGLLAPVTRLWRPNVEEAVRLATREVLSKGITTVQDAGASVATMRAFRNLETRGELQVRLWVMARDGHDRLARFFEEGGVGEGSETFAVGGIKRAIDGALGTHGAWLLEPYEDRPESTGFNTTQMEEIEEVGRLAVKHRLQLAVHAIGDRANRETLDLFERIWREKGVDGPSLRWRIEHAQTVHPDDVPRFAELGVIASMQGIHAVSDGPWVPNRLGMERARERAYVWRSLLDSGAVIVNGTDAPVEDVDPIPSIHASVTRQMANGDLFFPEQRMTREEALRSYTRDAAFSIFRENDLGTLAAGKLADIVVLSANPLTVSDDELRQIQVEKTILGGKIVFER